MNEDKEYINRLGFGVIVSILVAGVVLIIAILLIFLFYFIKNFTMLFK